jgi:hypothetical protein
MGDSMRGKTVIVIDARPYNKCTMSVCPANKLLPLAACDSGGAAQRSNIDERVEGRMISY